MQMCISSVVAAILIVAASFGLLADDDADYQSVKVEGWTLNIHKKLLATEKEETERAVQLLVLQLREIVRVVPDAVVDDLRKVPLWFSPEYPNISPRAEYHPSDGWLKENKRNPAMAKSVEFTNTSIFERETKRMPNFVLHELAHAYHDRNLNGGYDNADVKAAFNNARKQKTYEKVEQRHGDGTSSIVQAYAMTNPMEYFAECSEAYFSTNDFYPFDREQLREADPVMWQLVQKLWNCKPD